MQSRAIFYEEVSQRWRQWQQPRSMYPLFIINYSNLPVLFLFTKLMVDFPRKSCLSCTSGGESLVLINFPGRWGYWEGDESETNTHTKKKNSVKTQSSAVAGKLLHLIKSLQAGITNFYNVCRRSESQTLAAFASWMLLFYFLSFMSLQSWCVFFFFFLRFSVNILS